MRTPPYPSPIWPCLALFTPSGEAGMRPVWPRWASSRVARSGETFKTVSFRLISSHFVSFRLISSHFVVDAGSGMRGFRLPGDGTCNQCRVGAAMAQWAVVVGLWEQQPMWY